MVAFAMNGVNVAADTGGGTQDITISGFGTPKAAMFFMVRDNNVRLAGGTGGDSTAAWSIGLTDGSAQYVTSGSSDNGTATMDTYRRSAADEVLMLMDGSGNVSGEANFDSWITDGVRINWGNTPAGAWRMTVVLFNGDDLTNVDVGSATPSTSNAVQSASCGFSPDIVFIIGNEDTDGVNSHNIYTFAALDKYGGVAGNLAYDSDNQLSAVCSIAATVLASHSSFGTTAGTALRPLGMYSSGFQYAAQRVDTNRLYTDQSHGGGAEFGWLALKFTSGVVDARVQRFETPTSTGVVRYPCGSGNPIGAILSLGGGSTYHDWDTGSNDAAIGIASGVVTPDFEFTQGWASEDASANADTESYAYPESIRVHHDFGTTPRAAAVRSAFDSSDGFKLNWTTVDTVLIPGWMATFSDMADVPSGGGILTHPGMSGGIRG